AAHPEDDEALVVLLELRRGRPQALEEVQPRDRQRRGAGHVLEEVPPIHARLHGMPPVLLIEPSSAAPHASFPRDPKVCQAGIRFARGGAVLCRLDGGGAAKVPKNRSIVSSRRVGGVFGTHPCHCGWVPKTPPTLQPTATKTKGAGGPDNRLPPIRLGSTN